MKDRTALHTKFRPFNLKINFMRLLIIAVLLVFNAVGVSAQNLNETIQNRHEISVDGTRLLNIFRDATGNFPYYFTYRYNFERSAIRLSFSGNMNNRSGPYTLEDTILNRDDKNYQLRLRAGYEWQQRIASRWLVHYGLDATLFYSFRSNRRFSQNHSSGFFDEDLTRSRGLELGAGPQLGFKFMPLPHFAVGTEASLIFNTGSSRYSREQENNQYGPDSYSNTRFTDLEFYFPVTVLISYYFPPSKS